MTGSSPVDDRISGSGSTGLECEGRGRSWYPLR